MPFFDRLLHLKSRKTNCRQNDSVTFALPVMYRFISLFLFSLLFTQHAAANPSSIAAIRLRESELVKTYRSLTQNIFTDRHDSIARSFRENLETLLKEEISSSYPFDSLRRFVQLCKSRDGKVRTFSWDELEGGNWHNMTAFAQFRTSAGKLDLKRLDSETDDEAETGNFSDVKIYSIHELTVGGFTSYLLIGSGTHGGGMHHALARVFAITHGTFEMSSNAFGKSGGLITEIPRSFPPDMRYDEKTATLCFNSYSFGDELTGKGRGLKPMTYIFTNGVFVKR
jgi:hypothetical protein